VLKSIKQLLIQGYEFVLLSPIALACKWMEVFVEGEAQWKGQTIQDRVMRKAFLKKGAATDARDPDGRYRLNVGFVNPCDKVMDLGSAHGRLSDILSQQVGSIDYLGLEYDVDLVGIARNLGRNVEQSDLNDLERFEERISAFKPDVVFFMYVSCSIKEPQKVLAISLRHAKKVVFGGANYGHWTQRLRYLFGRGPVTGINLYESFLQLRHEAEAGRNIFSQLGFARRHWVPDTTRYSRLWTKKDYLALFSNLDARYKMIGYRGYRHGSHYKWMPFGGLRAKGFQFLLTPSERAASKSQEDVIEA
jgi:hypothetical protein